MANILKYSIIILVAIFAVTVVLPIAIGLFIGGVIAYYGMKWFVSTDSIFTKIISGLIIIMGAGIMLSAIPVLPLLVLAIAAYFIYKWYDDKKEVKPVGSPFENFNKEWKNITK